MSREADDGIAHAKALRPVAQLAHHARDLRAGDEGQRRLHLVEPAHHERIGKIERGGANLYQHLSGGGPGRGHLAHGERLGAVEARADDGPHRSVSNRSLNCPRWKSASPKVALIIVRRLNQWLTMSSSVTPIAPCSWIACWPTKPAAWPMNAFPPLTRRVPSPGPFPS